MQLLYYLYTLKMAGVEAKGELRFPEQKKKEIVELTPELELELEITVKEIRAIMAKEIPPAAKRIKYCPKCAYRELCWA
jgi:CRISPR-associated exonuclease Cas4